MGKQKHFEVKSFLSFWLEAEIHAVPKEDFNVKGKVWENTNMSNLWVS